MKRMRLSHGDLKMRFSMIFMALLLMTLNGMAQMTLKVPRWERFARINKEGINLRKSPNANSPKLLTKGADWHQELSWTPKADFEAFHLNAGRVLPILKETGDWYCLYFGDYCYGEFRGAYEVYVMKKFCTRVRPVAMVDNDYEYSENERVKGEKDYVIGTYFLGSPSRAPWCRIGHEIGNYLVMADYDGYGSGMEFVRNYCTGDVMEISFDSDQVKDADIERFIKSQKAPKVFDIWIKFDDPDNFEEIPHPQKFVFDASTYKYAMDTYTSEPLIIKKFVVSAMGQELQMRQRPDIAAPKLMFVQDEDQTLFVIGNMVWENRWMNRNKAEKATSKVFAVVGETDGWYQVYDSYLYSDICSAVGYVQKKDVRDAQLQPITEAVLRDEKYNSRNGNGKTRVMSLSPINQFVVSWECPRVGICVCQYTNIGRIVGNTVFMGENEVYRYDEDTRKVEIGNSTFSGTRLVTTEDGYSEVDFTKLTVADALILQKENDKGNYAYAYVNIEGEMHIFSLRRLNMNEIRWPK